MSHERFSHWNFFNIAWFRNNFLMVVNMSSETWKVFYDKIDWRNYCTVDKLSQVYSHRTSIEQLKAGNKSIEMYIVTVNKFLCCFKLETGGYALGFKLHMFSYKPLF